MSKVGSFFDHIKYDVEADVIKVAKQIFGNDLESPFLTALRGAALAYLQTHQNATEAELVTYLESIADSLITATSSHFGIYGAAVSAYVKGLVPQIVPSAVSQLFATLENQVLGSGTSSQVSAAGTA